jgi:outer membrane autotransporter protein
VSDAPRAARLLRGRSVATFAATLAWLLLASTPLRGFAGTFVVTTTSDNDEALPEQSTLRDAVQLANLSPDPTSTITFALGPLDDDSIVLSDSLDPLVVEKVLVIDASSEEDLTIRGRTTGQTLFEVDSASSGDAPQLTLVDLAPAGGFVEIADANTLSFDVDGDSFLTIDLSTDSAIRDLPPPGDPPPPPVFGGSLVKEGGGTLQLLGLNTYTGGTEILEGTLRGDTPSLQGDIDVAGGATLIFDHALERTHAGNLDGAGLIVKAGTGTLTISGAGDFSGELAIDNGTLMASTTVLPGNPDIVIADVGILVFDETGDAQTVATYAGEITSLSQGAGVLRKAGDPTTLSLVFGNFSGTTEIEAGTLRDESNVIRGNVELSPGTVLVFAGEGTNSGVISGSGSVVKEGAGTVTLLGDNVYGDGAGGVDTTIKAGTLVGNTTSLKNDILVEAGTLEFDQATIGTFAGTIAGTGTVRKSGAGALVLPDPLAYTGPTVISAGQLVVNATLASPTTVEAAGVLGGTGTIAAPVTVRGTVSPSQKGTPFNVQSIEFRPGSALEIDIDSDGTADKVTSTSTASCKRGSGAVCDDSDPAIVQVQLGQGDFSTGTTATILEASSNIEGKFVATPQFASLGTVVEVDANQVNLTIGPRLCDLAPPRVCEFTDWAVTPNQTSVAGALDDADPAPVGSDMEAVIAELQKLTVPELPPTYDAIGGESISGFTTTRLAMGERLERTLHRRMRDVAWGGSEAFGVVDASIPVLPGSGGPALASAAGAGSALYPGLWASKRSGRMGSAATFDPAGGGPGFGGWLDAWGIVGSLDGDGNSADVDYKLAGTTLGLDYRFTERWIAGLAGGYAYTTFDLNGRETNSHAHNAQAALYGGYFDPRFYVGASARYSYGSNESERRITIGTLDSVARGDFDSNDFGARIEAGANVVRFGRVTLQPLAAFDWSQLGQDGFQETGADALDLDVDSETTTSLLSSVGARLHGRVELDEETSMVPELRAMWLHEFGDRDRIVRGRLTGALTGGDFRVLGAEAPRDSALVGLGWSATIGDAVRVFADYDAIIDSRRLEHNFALSVRVWF